VGQQGLTEPAGRTVFIIIRSRTTPVHRAVIGASARAEYLFRVRGQRIAITCSEVVDFSRGRKLNFTFLVDIGGRRGSAGPMKHHRAAFFLSY